MNRFNRLAFRCLPFGLIAFVSGILYACGGGDGSGSNPVVGVINGTAATGAPLSNAAISIVCKKGSANTTANVNGAYSTVFAFEAPCTITATACLTQQAGACPELTTLHSIAYNAGTFNVLPFTELLIYYLAALINITPTQLLDGITTNPVIHSTLSNVEVITNAQNAVTKSIQTSYPVLFSTPLFLTLPFMTSGNGQTQSQFDKTLDTLGTLGAITKNGKPITALINSAVAAGTAARTSPPTGGTGSTPVTR